MHVYTHANRNRSGLNTGRSALHAAVCMQWLTYVLGRSKRCERNSRMGRRHLTRTSGQPTTQTRVRFPCMLLWPYVPRSTVVHWPGVRTVVHGAASLVRKDEHSGHPARARHGLVGHGTVEHDGPSGRASSVHRACPTAQARPVGPFSVSGQPGKHDLFSRSGRPEARFSKERERGQRTRSRRLRRRRGGGRGGGDGVETRDRVEEAGEVM
jgi:hypothetical protein